MFRLKKTTKPLQASMSAQPMSVQPSLTSQFLFKLSEYSKREFATIPPYASKITLEEGPVNRYHQPWVADFVILPENDVRYFTEDGETKIGLPSTGYISIIDFARHITGNGCGEHANLKNTKKIVLEGVEELYEGPGRLPLLKVSEAPVDEEVIDKFKEEHRLLEELFPAYRGQFHEFHELHGGYYGYFEHGRKSPEIQKLERLEHAKTLLAEVIGHPVFRKYTFYEPLLGAMQAVAQLAIVRVQHPARISLHDTFSRSVLESEVIKMDPEYEVVFPTQK